MRIVFPTLHFGRSSQAVPLAAGNLAAALPPPFRKSARLLDLFPEQSPGCLREEIMALQPELIAFPLYVWNRTPILALTRELRRACPAACLIAGGPEASADPTGVLMEGELDAVVLGEGEIAFSSLVEAWAGGDRLSSPPGVIRRGPEGTVTGPEAPSPVLAELPSPWLTGILTPSRGGGVLWEISRGGAGGDFSFEVRAGGSRHMAAERLEAELDLFVAAGVAEIRLLDPAFNFPPERGIHLLQMLRRRAPHLRFLLDGRPEFLDPETVRLLSTLPASVRLELPSIHPEVQRHFHRAVDPELLARNIHLLRAEGVSFHIAMTFGLPGDSLGGFRSTLNAALELAPDRLDLSPVAIYPGTPLHRQRERFGMLAQDRPPYHLLASDTYPPQDLEVSRRLAAAVEIFYNQGRAGGFLPALLQAVGKEPVHFLEGFLQWAAGPGEIAEERLLFPSWRPAEILALQESYIGHLLSERGRAALIPAALDLIRYHYHQAETLAGEELALTRPELWQGLELWSTRWRRAPAARLATFTYEILDLLEMDEIELDQFVTLFRPVGSVALFTRRGGQVFCESLEENTVRLLLGSDGERSPREIFSGSLSRQEGEEILEFAVTEGLLVLAEELQPH